MEKNMIEEKQKVIFTPEQAQVFWKKYKFIISESTPIGCIDDRDPRERTAIPGGAGGVYLAVLDALKKYNIDPEKVFEIAKPIVGCAIHTDEKNAKIEGSSPVAGCGHCNGIAEKERSDPEYFKVLKEFFEKLQKGMTEPVIYSGSHNAKAVFVIEDAETGLISKTESGQVYVYNQAHHQRILKEVGDKLFENLKLAISKEEFNKVIWESAEKQLKSTLDHLTNGLPFFYSSKLK